MSDDCVTIVNHSFIIHTINACRCAVRQNVARKLNCSSSKISTHMESNKERKEMAGNAMYAEKSHTHEGWSKTNV